MNNFSGVHCIVRPSLRWFNWERLDGNAFHCCAIPFPGSSEQYRVRFVGAELVLVE